MTALRPGVSPFDTVVSSGSRFLVELVVWVAGPWAAADWTGSGWAAVPAAVVLLALPSVFSTPGDKRQVLIPTPGPIRFLLEILLSAVAVAAEWVAWPSWAGVVVSGLVAVALVSGWRRAKWLLIGAPSVAPS